jgi:hypothetical protein
MYINVGNTFTERCRVGEYINNGRFGVVEVLVTSTKLYGTWKIYEVKL